jgi:3'-phosphoadenosine 5'-phosphosulfate sulfotransferase (PAPS reductase)/FAD synthetase
MDDFAKMISFSGGRTSAYMLFRELPITEQTIVCFANTGKERLETLEFVRDCQQYFKTPIVWLEYCPSNKFKVVDFETASRKGEPFSALIEKRGYLPNVVTRFCTQDLKIRVIKNYLNSIGINEWDSLVGIRYDEPRRYSKLIAQNDTGKNKWDNSAPLYRDKITKVDVLAFWGGMPFGLNLHGDEGNCDLCFLKGKNKLIKLIGKHPDLAD